ncbi:MAG TPA: HD domain-containing phosphohydrolase [Longimicrobium sp.]|nr:HD domain-containing phosphohydrolase [Longimicrobium sp.]
MSESMIPSEPGGAADGVLAHLHAAERGHRAQEARLHQALGELAQAHDARRRLEAELERERRAAAEAREAAEAQWRTVREIHRSLFGGDVHRLVLQASLAISGGTRGMYLAEGRSGRPRVRAAIGFDAPRGAEPSPFIAALAARVLAENDSVVCNDLGDIDALPRPDERVDRFRNLVAAPVVLASTPGGVVVVADKESGDFVESDVESLLSVGDQAGVALRNADLKRELQSAYVSTITMLADAVEAKDPYTHGHCEMASRYARLVAERLELADYDSALVCYAALLHDVGKIGVSDGVLHKPGPLLPEEMELMRAHVRVGHDLLCTIPALRAVADVVLHHHEWYDGAGYPDGLRGEQIPMPARIVAAVDAYCAMVTRRSYKEAYTREHARAELLRCAGTQFDPDVVQALLAVLDDPESLDRDDDDWAECGMPPDFLALAAQAD